MNYIIIESQTTNGTTAVLTSTKTDYFAAEQEYHTKLAYAAASTVPLHAVTMLTERGNIVKYECYSHETEEPVTEE